MSLTTVIMLRLSRSAVHGQTDRQTNDYCHACALRVKPKIIV